MKKFILFIKICIGFDIKLYPPLGIAVENKDNSIIVTNGYVKTRLRIELKLPTIDQSLNETSCKAKGHSEFETMVQTASQSFRAQIQSELEEFIDTNANFVRQKPTETKTENGSISADNIKTNPLLCNDDTVKCKYFPVIDVNPDDNKELMLRACYNSNLGESPKTCKVSGATTICCSKKKSDNVGTCLTKGMEKTLSMIHRHELTDTKRVHRMGHGEVSQRRVRNYCIAVLSAEINGKEAEIGTYTDVKGEAAKNLPIQSRRKRGASRSRRSTWEYYASGGFWTSEYIDNQIAKIQDVMKADHNQIKEALDKNSKTLLTLQADKYEQDRLQAAVCSTSEKLTEEIILTELRGAHSKLEFKADSALKACANSEVPDQIENSVLTKICSSMSDSKFCHGSSVRSLFRCKLDQPLITMDVVGIATILTMHIPLSEDYSALKFHGIGVPFQSESLDTSVNITDAGITRETDKESSGGGMKEDDDELGKIFRKLIVGLKEEVSRPKREIVSTYHFLEIKSIPDIVVQFNGDYISFHESDFIDTPWARIVDYSQNVAENNECVRAILEISIPRITHFCELKLVTSNYPCLVKHLGEMGYLLSSRGKTTISQISERAISVFNNKEEDLCDDTVCVVPIGGAKKAFTCGKRQFFVGEHPDVEIKVETPKINAIDLSSLRNKKSDPDDLLFTGFKFLDKTPLTRKLLRQGTTVGTITSIIFSVILLIMILKIGIIQTVQWICHHFYKLCQPGRKRKFSDTGDTAQKYYAARQEANNLTNHQAAYPSTVGPRLSSSEFFAHKV